MKTPAKTKLFSWLSAFVVMGVLLCILHAGTANAAEGVPHEWQMNLQPAASPTMEKIHDFHDMMLYIISGISAFVLLLLIIVVLRFNSRANPTPSTRSHNTVLEVVWTVIPVVILVVVAVPSLKLLYYADHTKEPEMTLKVTGYQWYWGYEYPDHDDIAFNAYMIPDKDIDKSKGQLRLLSTDTPVVLPIDTNIQILVTSADVIHSWAIPAFGVKLDAVPGRLNETWVRIEKEGTYYGQCSELCGKDHAFMPIEVHAVSKDYFDRWVKSGGETLSFNEANDNEPQTRLANAGGDE